MPFLTVISSLTVILFLDLIPVMFHKVKSHFLRTNTHQNVQAKEKQSKVSPCVSWPVPVMLNKISSGDKCDSWLPTWCARPWQFLEPSDGMADCIF